MVLAWVGVGRTGEHLAMLRTALKGKPGVLVIGLAGGIGAGKSAVANILAEMGYLVVDSDRDAKEALNSPAVRSRLIEWWGPEVVDAEGRVRRSAVAEIVFSDPEQRSRLEALVHPIVKAERGSLVRRAREEGRPGVVVDAPLLFEAGSDSACDRVLFVDAPEELRRERVMRTRQWGPGELERREKAQIPLEEKRRRSDAVVVNDGDSPALRDRVAEAEATLRRLGPNATRMSE